MPEKYRESLTDDARKSILRNDGYLRKEALVPNPEKCSMTSLQTIAQATASTVAAAAATPAERVLCFPVSVLEKFPADGFMTNANGVGRVLDDIFFKHPLAFIDRTEAEISTEWVQLIPYCLIMRGRECLRYRRKGSEGRLTGLYSVGVGGHINPEDASDKPDRDTYYRALRRELLEEVGLATPEVSKPVGLIYDPSNEVGRVHFGVVHVVRVGNRESLTFTDPALQGGEFHHAVELNAHASERPAEYETWSRLVLTRYLG